MNFKLIIKQLRKDVTKNFGKKCKQHSLGCIICQAYRVVDDLEDLVGFFDKTER